MRPLGKRRQNFISDGGRYIYWSSSALLQAFHEFSMDTRGGRCKVHQFFSSGMMMGLGKRSMGDSGIADGGESVLVRYFLQCLIKRKYASHIACHIHI